MYLPWEKDGFQDISRDQVRIARELGKSVGAYVWPYAERSPWETLVEATNVCNSCDPPVVAPIIWLDIEESTYGPGPDSEWLHGWLQACSDLQTPTGFYIRRSWIKQYYPGGEDAFQEFAGTPLWVADYDGVADINYFKNGLPKGWDTAAAKQWGVTNNTVDRNVIRTEYTVYSGASTDPCADLKAELIQMTEKLDRQSEALRKISAALHELG
jgi:hypothetical protein